MVNWKLSAILLILGCLIITGLHFTSAEQTVKTVEFPLDYIAQPLSNTNYIQNVKIHSPDRISKIISMEIQLTGDFQANTNIKGKVSDGQNVYDCSPGVWKTPPLDAASYFMSFDCTDLVNQANFKGGDILLGFRTNKVAQNVKPRIKMTYLNNPKASIEIFGTEYVQGEEAKVWLQLINSTGDYVVGSLCSVDIYDHNNNEIVENAIMIDANHDGIYYYNYQLSSAQPEGVYPVIAKCYYETTETVETADGFTLNTGNVDKGNYTDTWTLDGNEHKIEQDAGSIDFDYNFDNMCGVDTNESVLTGLTLVVNAKWKDSVINDNIVLSIYNYTSSSWINLNNQIITPNDRVTVSNFISTNNLTRDGLIDPATNTSKINFNDTLKGLGGNNRIEVDLLQLHCEELLTPTWTEVKGSSEMHVTGDKNYLTTLDMGEMVNGSYIGNFTFHYTLSSQTSKFEEDQDVEFVLFKPFPCENVLNFQENYGNGTIVQLNYTLDTDNNGRCVISSQHDLNISTNYDIEIVSENYWKVQYERYKSLMALSTEMINISCQNYVLSNNLTNFTFPMNSTNYGQDNMWLSCAGYLDLENELQGSYSTFDPFLTIDYNFTLTEMESLESGWLHMEEEISELHDISNIIFNGLNLGNSYSLGLISDPYPPTNPLYATYFASISSSYLNYVSIGLLPKNVWNYEPRNVSVDVNETAIAEEIGYNETSIARAVWNDTRRPGITFLGGTTYDIGDSGKVIIRVIKGDDLQDNASCNLTIMYPNNTKYVNNVTMTNFGEGIYTYDFTVQGPYGVHTYYTDCTKNGESGAEIFGLNTFQVKKVSNSTAEDVWSYNNRSLTEFNFSVNVEINSTDVAKNVWEYAGGRNLTYTIDATNYSLITYNVWNATNRTITQFSFIVNTTNYNLTEQNVWEYIHRNLTYYEDVTNYTRIRDDIENISNVVLIEDIWAYTNRSIDAFPAHQYLGGTEYFANGSGKISIRLVQAQGGNSSVETGAQCNITILDPNNVEIVSTQMNEYGKGIYTYDFTVNQTLGVYTYYSDCKKDNSSYFGLNTFHVWDINESEISQDVWSHNTRELTYYPTTNITLSNDSVQELGNAVWKYEGNITTNILYQFADTIECYLQNLLNMNDEEWSLNIRAC